MKNLRRLTWLVFLGCTPLLVGAGLWFGLPAQRDVLLDTQLQPLLAQWLGDSPELAEAQQDPARIEQAIEQGNQLLQQARTALAQRKVGFTANLLQVLQSPSGSYRATGRIAQAANGKSRLEVNMQVLDTTGKLLQVSNGQVMWVVREMRPTRTAAGSAALIQSPVFRIDRVDLQRIEELSRQHGWDERDPHIARELHGGLAGLLATLAAELDFQLVRKILMDQQEYLVLEGKWKPEFADRTFASAFAADVTRSTVPDRVRLYLRARDLLPVRYVCLKKRPADGVWYAQLAMELTDLVENAVIDSSLFNYPSTDQVPNDITHESLKRLESLFLTPPVTAAASATDTATR